TVAANDPATVLLNEACPVCVTEMAHYERIAVREARPLSFRRIADAPQALERYGLSAADIRRRLFVVEPNGAVVSGIDAAIAVWRQLPRYRWLAAVAALPGFHRLGDVVYEAIVVPTVARLNRGRRAAAIESNRHDRQHA